MVKAPSFKRLILRAVVRQVSPMVIRLVSVSDRMPLHEFHDVFRTILGWNGDLGYIIRVHSQEFTSFRRKTRSKALHEFKLHRLVGGVGIVYEGASKRETMRGLANIERPDDRPVDRRFRSRGVDHGIKSV